MGYNSAKMFREIHASGRGVKELYFGLDSFVAARAVHLLVRNLLYKIIYDYRKPVKASNDLSNREKGVIGGIAGGIAALVSNPLDLINIR